MVSGGELPGEPPRTTWIRRLKPSVGVPERTTTPEEPKARADAVCGPARPEPVPTLTAVSTAARDVGIAARTPVAVPVGALWAPVESVTSTVDPIMPTPRVVLVP